MQIETAGQVRKLLQANKKVSLFCTGAGAGVGKLIWDIPGASSTLVKFSVPYDQLAFDQEIGFDWGQAGKGYCSKGGAVALAQAAYLSAQRACAGQEAIGVGLSAAASTSRVLRGGTRCFAAVRTAFSLKTVELQFEQGALGRGAEGEICDLVALNLAFQAAGIDQVPLRRDELRLVSSNLPDAIGVLAAKELDYPTPALDPGFVITLGGEAQPLGQDFSQCVIFPGSFKPFHYGHDGIARLVADMTGKRVMFEITAANADKDPVAGDDAVARAKAQFTHRWPVIVRRDCGLFIDKAAAYKGASFIVGYDTAVRILDGRFYQEAGLGVDHVLLAFQEAGARFFVAPRMAGGELAHCGQLPLKPEFRHLFQPVNGRWDVSSSSLRGAL